MRTVLWWFVAAAGSAVMIWAYRADRPDEGSAPFSSGFIFVSKAGSKIDPADKNKPVSLAATKARAQTLPLTTFASLVVGEISKTDAQRGQRLEFQLSETVFELSLTEARISETALAWGRLPRSGQNEVVAGFRTLRHDAVEIAGRTLPVVGGLRRDVALLSRSYLVARGASDRGVFDAADPATRSAVLIALTPSQLDEPRVNEELTTHFPVERFHTMSVLFYTERKAYFGSLFGQMLLCLGGSGGLIGLYAAGARRVKWRVLRDPLVALSDHKRLLWGVHAAYFGLYLLGAFVIYHAPDVQDTLLAVLQKEIQGGSGPLAVAGTAYASKSVLRAAVATFAINFFLGSLACLTIPSCVVPGSGTLVAAGRALLWGVVLAPTSRLLARTMLPHSGTLLLEGEGYILATFFGLLVPIALFRSDPVRGLFARYRQAVGLNLKGNLLVALVLAVAALYEAVEVILQMK